MRALALSLVLFPLLDAAPLDARQSEFRRTWTFFGDHLPIEVASSSAGELRIVRGGRGQLEVAGQARAALLSAVPPRTPGEPLRISASARGPSAWVVVVPDHVHVTILLPGRGWAVPASTEPFDTYRWEAERRPVRRAAAGPPAKPAREALVLTYTDPTTPAVVDLPDLRAVLRLGVRVEDADFAIATSRPLELRRGDPARLEIRPGEPLIELVLIVPNTADELRITAAGRTVATVRAGLIETDCSPVTLQTLSDGTRTADFTPLEGRLECGQSGVRGPERAR